jgi:Concanavalin A-like lectin/glucanases superfamily
MRPQVTALIVLLSACDLLVSPESLTGGVSDGGPDAPAVAVDSGLPADGGADAVDADEGLVAYWSFDEGSGQIAHDGSKMRNDAVLNSGASWGPGHRGTALVVNGQDGAAFVDENGSISLSSEMSVACWVNLDDVANDPRIFEKRYAWGMKLNGRSPQLELGEHWAISSAPVPPGEWHHVAFTYARGDVHAYTDGREVELQENNADAGGVLDTWDGGLVIGTSAEFQSFAKGRIDELRIYGRVLRAAEIAALAR